LAGDEFGNSQAGNNNAYCQDNETSWLDWIGRDRNLADFVAALIHLRHDHAALRHANWFTGTRLNWSDSSDIEAGNSDSDVDISWRNPDGTNLSSVDWEDRHCRSFACLIAVADTGLKPAERWLLVFHASSDVITVALPPGPWVHVLDSSAAMVLPQTRWATAKTYAGAMTVSPRSIFGLVQTLDAPETLTKLHNS
jgi:glycogen operon protein